MKNISEVIVLVVYLAMVTVMVRPNSKGPDLVNAAGNSLTGLIKSASSF
jgi:hypothetical protein